MTGAEGPPASSSLAERDERTAPVTPVHPAPPSRAGRIAKAGLGTVAWALLLLLVATATAVLFLAVLPVARLGSPPIGKAVVILLALVFLAGATVWVVARFVSSWRTAGRVVSPAVVLLLLAATVWAVSAPGDSLFLARSVGWGDSDMLDHQRFPARSVANAGPVSAFARRPVPELFRTAGYWANGQGGRVSFEDFLTATKTTSLIVVKDGAILYEGYANGYDRGSIVTSFSVAKSVTSALVGIAIDEGLIGGVDDPMVAYLPELRGRGMDDVTIRDLLLMSSGVRFIPQADKAALATAWPFHDEALSYYHPDLRRVALHLPASDEPRGAAFTYNPYHPILLGMILERTTHRPVARYLQEKIWQPLGMEYPASWSLDSEASGFEKMESGINGRAIDFARFGRLFLAKGDWNGRRIVSERWVTESTAPGPADARVWRSDPEWKAAGGSYRYMWWGMPAPGGGYAYTARGHLGQRIAVFPRDGVVIVRFGLDDGGVDWDQVIQGLAAKVR